MDTFRAVVGAGTLRSTKGVGFTHRWTPEGVTVDADFTGGHLLHLAAAGCVLNDLYREAAQRGIALDGVRVAAEGGFDTETWTSTGIRYAVELESSDTQEQLDELVADVDEIAEIPRALRAGASVTRVR